MRRNCVNLTSFVIVIGLLWGHLKAKAQEALPAIAQIAHNLDTLETIQITGSERYQWTENQEKILLLNGKVEFQQGDQLIRCNQAIIWFPQNQKLTQSLIHVYARDQVSWKNGQKVQAFPQALFTFHSKKTLTWQCKGSVPLKNLSQSELYQYAFQLRQKMEKIKNASNIQLVQNIQTAPGNDPNNSGQTIAPPSLNGNNGNGLQPLPKGPKNNGNEPIISLPPREINEGVEVTLPTPSQPTVLIAPRTSAPFRFEYKLLAKEEVVVITGGVKFLAVLPDDRDPQKKSTIDIESDQMVLWSRGGNTRKLFGAMNTVGGTQQSSSREIQIYVSGNVAVRTANNGGNNQDTITIRAEEAFYDVQKGKALALGVDMELSHVGLSPNAHVRADELVQLSPDEWQLLNAGISASKLPADPGLEVRMTKMMIYQEKQQVRRTIFGLPFRDRETGEPLQQNYRTYEGTNARVNLEGVPIFYSPYMTGEANDPFGPLKNFNFRQDQIFGTQFLTTWDIFKLIGTTKLPNERWDLYLDYMSLRGPGFGTTYEYGGKQMFGEDTNYAGIAKLYGVYDSGHDVLGSLRDNEFVPPHLRGRAFFRHQQDYENWVFQAQLSYLSDPRFYEQYYKYEFDTGPNQETFLYGKYQDGNNAFSVLGEPNFFRDWVTQTAWYPKVAGYSIGNSFFDRFTYSAWGSMGYAQLRPSIVYPFPVLATDQRANTGRFDVMQEVSMPFSLGAFRVVPYGKFDLADYTADLQGNNLARAYGGVGVRSSLPLSRLYPESQSELLNVNGLFHKIVFRTNYYKAWSSSPYYLLPQLDRLNDDAIDQTVRDITPFQTAFVQGPNGLALATSPIFNPQLYAIRRLLDTNPDTLDSIQVLQTAINQRLQTKRGYPGMEHTVDWLTLDLSASFFPAPNHDNFGQPVSFIEYGSTWFAGDQTGITSAGWFDPFNSGARYWNITGFLNRPDRTSYSISYRQTDPLNSRVVSASVGYIFSPKYAVNASTAYDFGINESISNSLMFTRVGKDLSMSVGITYNAIVNNFGINFMIIPNVVSGQSGSSALSNAFGGGNPYATRR